jgi:hypothetical protein
MIQGYWIQEFAASLLNYPQKTKIQNHYKNTRYKSKCPQCCTRVSLHFKVPFGLNLTCDKINQLHITAFHDTILHYKPWDFSHTVYPGKQLQWKSSCRDTQVPLLQFWDRIHESTISMRFLGIILRFSDFYLCFWLSTKCYSWKNLSFLDCFVWNSETIGVIWFSVRFSSFHCIYNCWKRYV